MNTLDRTPLSGLQGRRDTGLEHKVHTGFASVLDDVVRSRIPARLIDEPGWARLLEGMSGLPAWAADGTFGFECDLSVAEAWADLSLSVAPEAAMAGWLVERGRREGADAPAAALADYFDELARPGSFLARLFKAAILEYDIPPAPEAGVLPAPGLFLCLRRGRGPEYVNAGIIDAVLAFATASTPDPRRLRVLEAIWRAFPPGVRLPWCAVMQGRSPAPMRLGLICRRTMIPALLRAMGHPGRLAAVEDVLAMIEDLPDRLCLSLDMTPEGLVPRLGIEMHVGTPTGRDGWNGLLSSMADRGWILPDKGAALAGCAGSERFFGRDGETTTLSWGVNHVKVVIGERETTAKGYIICVLRRSNQESPLWQHR